MYDPARDAFTASDDNPPQTHESAPHLQEHNSTMKEAEMSEGEISEGQLGDEPLPVVRDPEIATHKRKSPSSQSRASTPEVAPKGRKRRRSVDSASATRGPSDSAEPNKGVGAQARANTPKNAPTSPSKSTSPQDFRDQPAAKKQRRSTESASATRESPRSATPTKDTPTHVSADTPTDAPTRHSEPISPQDSKDQPSGKQGKQSNSSGTSPAAQELPVPLSSGNLPRFSRRKPGSDDAPRTRRPQSPIRRRSPPARRDSPRRSQGEDTPKNGLLGKRPRSPSPPSPRREPTPPPQSPPRKLKRPGGASRLTAAEKEALRKRQEEREQGQARETRSAERDSHDVVKEHYNAVPERGRDWRRTDSRIRGLRAFNNWVKSTIIQKFAPNDDSWPSGRDNMRDGGRGLQDRRGLLVLDMGCGKGGDLGKWQQAPQPVELYVGVDPADVSIHQAQDRYWQMRDGDRGRGRGQRGGRNSRLFHAEFFVKDAFGEWLGDIPLIREVGIDSEVGPGTRGGSRWGGGGFDVVSMMFCMHYAFESEAKVRGMLRNVAGSLKKGGRLIGTIPNSDVLREKVVELRKKRAAAQEKTSTEASKKDQDQDQEPSGKEEQEPIEWGNSIYRVRFPSDVPENGVFKPPFGWKYTYFLDEAIGSVPEYVVPWESFRAIAEDYNLELRYRRRFPEVWKEERDDPVLGPLSERMGVRERGKGPLLVRDEEMEAASFYVAFCFHKL